MSGLKPFPSSGRCQILHCGSKSHKLVPSWTVTEVTDGVYNVSTDRLLLLTKQVRIYTATES